MPPIPYHVVNEREYEPVVVWNGAGTGLSGTRLLVAEEHARRLDDQPKRGTPAADVLQVLSAGQPLFAREIARALGVTHASTLNRVLWSLEQGRHVEVAKRHNGHRWMKVYRLASSGR